MTDLRSTLERGVGDATPPPDGFERMLRRGERKRRTRRITAGAVAFAVFAIAIWVVTSGEIATRGGGSRPASSGVTGPEVTGPAVTAPASGDWVDPPVATAPWVTSDSKPETDVLLDVDTGSTTPVPASILTLVDALNDGPGEPVTYAASPDGSMLAFSGRGIEGNVQIFVANLDGTDVRQVTHGPTGAYAPAWSPEGGSIAYVSDERDGIGSLSVLDVATGASTLLRDDGASGPSFTPDGASILYTGSGPSYPLELRTVPVVGGPSTPLFDHEAAIKDSGNGAISPDGSLVTFLSSDGAPTGEALHCGPCRYLASVDGSNRQVISGWMAVETGTWSPDGTRIVAMEVLGELASEGLGSATTEVIVVVDVETEQPTIVSYGRYAIWVDDHTILVRA